MLLVLDLLWLNHYRDLPGHHHRTPTIRLPRVYDRNLTGVLVAQCATHRSRPRRQTRQRARVPEESRARRATSASISRLRDVPRGETTTRQDPIVLRPVGGSYFAGDSASYLTRRSE
jgi:hypothetical protein